MAQVSKPVLWGGVIAIAAAAYWSFGSDSEGLKAPVKKKKPAIVTPGSSDYVAADFTTRFERPKVKVNNLFLPLILPGSGKPVTPPAQDIVKIPSTFADGNGDWTFTGFAIANNVKMALLENASTKEAGYVKEGEKWKTSRVSSITPQHIVLVDKEGTEQMVLRFNPDLLSKSTPSSTPGTPPGGVPPVDLSSALRGPIGPRNFRLQPMMIDN